LEYNKGIKNDLYYYYNLLYNSESNDYNDKFISRINFYTNSEENNALEKVKFEKVVAENINGKL